MLTYATFGRSGSPPLPSFPCFPAFSVAQLSFSGGVFPLFIPGTKQEECRLLCFKLKCPPDIEELMVANQMPDPSLFHPCRCNLGLLLPFSLLLLPLFFFSTLIVVVSDGCMKTAVFGRDSEGPSPCGGPPSLTFTPPAALAPPPRSRSVAAGGRPHSRRASRMQNVRVLCGKLLGKTKERERCDSCKPPPGDTTSRLATFTCPPGDFFPGF